MRKTRLTLDLDDELLRQLELLAAAAGTSTQEFCIRVIAREIEFDAPQTLTAASAPALAALWDNEADAAAYDDVKLS